MIEIMVSELLMVAATTFFNHPVAWATLCFRWFHHQGSSPGMIEKLLLRSNSSKQANNLENLA
jgi:hypothetical protein